VSPHGFIKKTCPRCGGVGSITAADLAVGDEEINVAALAAEKAAKKAKREAEKAAKKAAEDKATADADAAADALISGAADSGSASE
jgi:hypothetical protein